jgi:hypothetical protein
MAEGAWGLWTVMILLSTKVKTSPFVSSHRVECATRFRIRGRSRQHFFGSIFQMRGLSEPRRRNTSLDSIGSMVGVFYAFQSAARPQLPNAFRLRGERAVIKRVRDRQYLDEWQLPEN